MISDKVSNSSNTLRPTYIRRARQDLSQCIAETHALPQDDGHEISERVAGRRSNEVLQGTLKKVPS